MRLAFRDSVKHFQGLWPKGAVLYKLEGRPVGHLPSQCLGSHREVGVQERSPHVATLKSLCKLNQAAKSGRSGEEVLCQAQSFRRAEWLRCGPELPRPEKSCLVLQPTCVWGLGALWNQLGHTLFGSNSWKLLQRPLCLLAPRSSSRIRESRGCFPTLFMPGIAEGPSREG